LHKYSYTHGDPVNYTDPTGRFIGITVGFLGGLFGQYFFRSANIFKTLGLSAKIVWFFRITFPAITALIGLNIEARATAPQLRVVRASGASRVVFRATGADIRAILQEAVDANDPVTEFMLVAHGDEDQMDLPSNTVFRANQAFRITVGAPGEPGTDLTGLFERAIAPNANIYLTGCNTAKGDQNIARRMSRILPGRVVYGQSDYAFYVGFLYAAGIGKRYVNNQEQ
jgi:hypothetical protein